MIAVIALVASYGWYYQRLSDERVATIGQNLAQLELEDIRSKSKDDLFSLCHGSSIGDTINYPQERSGMPGYENSTLYDPGDQDGTFTIQHVATVLGHSPSSVSDIPGLVLPAGTVVVQPTYWTPSGNDPYWDYTVVLNQGVFPHYTKRVTITDTTPLVTVANNKIFNIAVTVKWLLGSSSKSTMVSSEK